jgi:predicted alpha-1,2-mannosidase
MRLLLLCALALGCARPDPSTEPIAPYDPIPLVDPFIGTGGVAARIVGLNPGATTPFGFVQVGPDTRHSTRGQLGFYHFGGYHYDDDRIDGFGHTHANGMGVNDYGGVVVLPRTRWDDTFTFATPRAAPFRHETEVASPGYFEVRLDDDGTRVQIAATTHGAVHRYTFEDTAGPIVMFDLGYQLGEVEIDGASVALAGDTLRAYQLLLGGYTRRAGGLPHHVYATMDPAPVASGVWTDELAPAAGTAIEGREAGIWMRFPPGTEVVTMRVALSTTGPEGAARNHAAEVAGRSLEDVKAAAEDAWRAALATVRVRGGTDEERVTFHTALYRAMIWPQRFQDVDGTYRGFDGELHVDPAPQYTAYSLWDTFRTVHPLLTLAAPEQNEALIASLLRMADQGGDLPRWPIAAGYTSGMIGSPGAIAVAEAAMKGLDVGDPDRALDHAARAALGPRPNAGRSSIEAYRELGWVPHDEDGGAASKTIEYAWADHAIAAWAEREGRTDLVDAIAPQAGHWRNTWDPIDRFFLGRDRSGAFQRRYNPLVWTGDFIEGTAWHYRFGAPFDLDGMIAVQNDGDTDAFLADLGAFWELAEAEDAGIAFEAYYWHGNEPCLHYGFLGSLAGDRAMSARNVDWIRRTRYGTGPDGLNGNDDAGTLSSWYVLASSGFYPIAGTTTYAVASPIWERVEIGDYVVRREGEGLVPAEIRLGDEILEGGTFTHDAWREAGELVFVFDDAR